MRYWGAGIPANDVFEECKEIFYDNYYHEKISVKQIEDKILAIFSSQDEGGLHNAYFALADCEWKCGCLSREIFSAAEEIITSGKDIDYWKSLKPKAKIIRRRENCLQIFLDKIKSENPKPAKRSYRKRFEFPLKTGDVFAHFSKANGCYGCGVVLEAINSDAQNKNWSGEYNFRALVAISELTPKFLPTVEEMLSENALDVFWNGGSVYTLPKSGFIVIDNIADKIDKDYSHYFGSFAQNGRLYLSSSPRSDFDKLISKDENYRVKDKFTLSNKPMTYFFNKNNLKKTEEILK